MTETSANGKAGIAIDRTAYEAALNKFDAALCEAIAVSQASAGRYPPTNVAYASYVFTQMCGAATSMIRAAPLTRWAQSDFEDWRFGAVAGHATSLVDGFLLFYYLMEPANSDAELTARINVMHLYDCTRRIELLKKVGVTEDLEGLKKQRADLQERLSSCEHFRSLSPSVQENCMNGRLLTIDTRDELLVKVGFGKNQFDALYDLWSQHVHVLPLSFYRVEANGRGTGIENDTDRSYIAQALETCAAVVMIATDMMADQFPDVSATRQGVQSTFSPGPFKNRPRSGKESKIFDGYPFQRRDRPNYVKRYMAALGLPAIKRWQSDQAHRELAERRSMQVIEKPWESELSPVGASREFTFLRDFWNLFHECIQACQTLDLVRDLAANSMNSIEPQQHSATVTFWMESYLNEVYIFQCRLLDLIKFIQRRYKKDADFTAFVVEVGDSLAVFVQEQLAPLIQDRGAHVHARRHRLSDPELVKLTLLDTMIDVLGHEELTEKREQSRIDSASWLLTQVRHYSDLAWHLFDEVCRGFSDGILLDIDRIIVPTHLKDDPEALCNLQASDSGSTTAQ